MLLDRAAGVAVKISEYQKLQTMAHEGEKFQTRAKQLGDISEKVSRTSETLAKFAGAGVTVNFVPTDGAGYVAKATALRAAIKNDPAVINNPPFDLKNEFTERLVGIVNAADKAMAEAWRSYVTQRSDFGSSDVVSALADVPQFRQSAATIRRCRADIDRLANVFPSSPKTAVVQLNELIALHDAAWSELSAEDIPAEVINFIRAAGSEGAALMAYSDEVRIWLASRNLMDAFRIKIR